MKTLISLVLLFGGVVCIMTPTTSQNTRSFGAEVSLPHHLEEPGGAESDAGFAINFPDDYAWRIFAYINQQADPNSPGVPDPTKSSFRCYDADKDVVWESWALASGDQLSEAFPRNGQSPPEWIALMAQKRGNDPKARLTTGLTDLADRDLLLIASGRNKTRPVGSDSEVRINRSTYETIRSNGLYNQEGLLARAKIAKLAGEAQFIQFDRSAKEVKAVWIPLEACNSNSNSQLCSSEKMRYHWRTIINAGLPEYWGLAALHITTKDLPDWFWADFIHEDCDQNRDPCQYAFPPRQLPSAPLGGKPYPGTKGTKWHHYLLRGTETGFFDNNGNPSQLFNPKIEIGTTGHSSCITCHAYARMRLDPLPLDGTSMIRPSGRAGDIGAPSECMFHGVSGDCNVLPPPQNTVQNRDSVQSDFVWSIIKRAQRDETVATPPTHSGTP